MRLPENNLESRRRLTIRDHARAPVLLTCVSLALSAGCAKSEAGGGDAGDDDGSSKVDPSGDAGEVDGSASGDDPSQNTTLPNLDEGGETNTPTAGDDESSTSGQSGDDDDTHDDLPKFDLGVPDADPQCPGGYDFSVIWIANSTQGTVSKIDTLTTKEVARYRTGPNGRVDPSRTSVNLLGTVAVANRTGSLTIIAARPDKCIDLNGDGIIQTSMGRNDVLEWERDECVLHHTELGFQVPQGAMNNDGGPRGLAWDAGTRNSDDPCEDPDPRLWVGWRDQPTNDSLIRRYTGDLSDYEEVRIKSFFGQEWSHGVYGGAADADGNFWGLGTYLPAQNGIASGALVRVDAETLEYEVIRSSGRKKFYGMALDADGNPWTTGYENPFNLFKYDVAAGRWEDHGTPPVNTNNQRPSLLRGMMIDRNHHAWIAGNFSCGVSQYDTKNEKWINGLVELDGCSEPVGISIDSEDYVWVVDREAQRAYKVHNETYETTWVDGLVSPYTYSDMTGAGLRLVVDPPG